MSFVSRIAYILYAFIISILITVFRIASWFSLIHTCSLILLSFLVSYSLVIQSPPNTRLVSQSFRSVDDSSFLKHDSSFLKHDSSFLKQDSSFLKRFFFIWIHVRVFIHDWKNLLIRLLSYACEIKKML